MFKYDRPSILAKGRNFTEPTRQHLNPYTVAGMQHRLRGSLNVPRNAGPGFIHGFNREDAHARDFWMAMPR